MFCSRLDKEWGLIDCVSFVVMQERGLTSVLTTDEHFEQAAHSFDFNEAWSLVGVGSVAAELATSDHLAAVTANRAFGVGDDHAFCKGREVFV